MKEIRDLHEPFIRFLNSQGIPFIRSRSDRESTTTPGDPDFVLLKNGSALCIEMKTDKGSLSAAQKARHEAFRRAGTTVHVCRDIGIAVERVKQWESTLREPITTQPPPAGKPYIADRGQGHGDWVFEGDKPVRRATIADLKEYPRK